MKICSFADIHWHSLKRHEEYTKTFTRVFKLLKEEIKPDIICLLGDYYHTKTSNISPEVIERLSWMFKSFAEIASTHVILGNHDLLLNNLSRLDVISPIIYSLNHPNLYFHKQSESNVINKKIIFHSFSCFDKEGWNKIKPSKDYINIALFHGSVKGATTETDWVLKGTEVNLDFFNGHNFVLLGDIHKQQFLDKRKDKNGIEKPYIGYASSTIQQNWGETENNHGFLLWNIREKNDWDVDFIEIENKQPFITVPWMGTVQNTIENIIDTRKEKIDLVGTRYRIAYKEKIQSNDFKELETILKKKYFAEVVKRKDETEKDIYSISIDAEKTIKSRSLRNHINTLTDYYKQYIECNNEKLKLSKEQTDIASMLIKTYIDKLNEEQPDESIRDIVWSIKELKFDNTFGYGENNSINFSKLKGIVGILGNNYVGKSSIIGSLVYSLFNSADRKITKTTDIVNENKNYCSTEVLISLNNEEYSIKRKTTLSFKRDKSSTNVSFNRLSNSIEGNQNSLSRQDTDKEIRKLIGTANDFLLTACSNQDNITKFINESGADRKQILYNFLDLNIFDKLYDYVKEDLLKLNNNISGLKYIKDSNNEENNIEIFLKQKRIEHKELSEQIKDLELKIENELDFLSKNNIDSIQEKYKKQKELKTQIQYINANIDFNQKDNQIIEQELQKDKNRINTLFDLLNTCDITLLKSKQIIINDLKNKMIELSNNHKKENVVLEQQHKNIKKLQIVPCGTIFPNCHFIKDAYEDLLKITEQTNIVQEIVNKVNELKPEIEELQKLKIEQQIQTHESYIKELEIINLKIQNKEIRKASLNEKNEVQQKSLFAFEKELVILEEELKTKNVEDVILSKSKLEELKKELKQKELLRNNILVEAGIKKEKLSKLKEDKEQYNKLSNEIKIYESIIGAFSKNGIPALVLKKQLPLINEELCNILNKYVDFSVSIDLDNNNLNVFLEKNNKKRIIELCSGAERTISSLALRVALVKLSSLPKPDFFIIDEGFSTLDEDNLPKILDFLQALKEQFKIVFVISHLSQIKEAAEIIIDIQNNGMESYVKV